ncbi:MAG: hypothetical protein ACKO2P_11680 [Planctomycetota bacterium]
MPSATPPEHQRRQSKRARPVAQVPSLLWRTFNYRCPFCLKVLQPLPLRFPATFWFVLGMRPTNCPHCFDMRWTPCHYLKYAIAPFRFLYLAVTEDVD